MGYMYEFPHTSNFDSDLRQIIEMFFAVKELPKTIEELEKNYTDLKLFVENYFNDLNVDEIISAKLEEMKNSGELFELFVKAMGYIVTPQMFGAKADGVSDDSTAINTALEYCSTNNISRLFIPKGYYGIAQPIRIKIGGNLKIYGASMWGAILTRLPQFTDGNMIEFKRSDRDGVSVTLEDVRLEQNHSVNSGAAIYVKDNSLPIILRNVFMANGLNGIDIEDGGYITIDTVHFEQNYNYFLAGHRSNAGIILRGAITSGVFITNSTFQAHYAGDADKSLKFGILIHSNDGLQVVNSHFKAYYGVFISPQVAEQQIDDCFFSNCIIDNCGAHCIYSVGECRQIRNIRFSDCHINLGIYDTNNSCISWNAISDYIQFIGCNVQLAGAYAADFQNCNQLIINSCLFTNNAQPVRLLNGENIIFSNNIFKNNAYTSDMQLGNISKSLIINNIGIIENISAASDCIIENNIN